MARGRARSARRCAPPSLRIPWCAMWPRRRARRVARARRSSRCDGQRAQAERDPAIRARLELGQRGVGDGDGDGVGEKVIGGSGTDGVGNGSLDPRGVLVGRGVRVGAGVADGVGVGLGVGDGVGQGSSPTRFHVYRPYERPPAFAWSIQSCVYGCQTGWPISRMRMPTLVDPSSLGQPGTYQSSTVPGSVPFTNHSVLAKGDRPEGRIPEPYPPKAPGARTTLALTTLAGRSQSAGSTSARISF